MARGVRFVFGVDLDGVCADFYRALKPIAEEWTGVPDGSLSEEVSWGLSEWGLEEYGGYDMLHRFAVVERNLFETVPPMPGAAATLRRLSAMDVRIRIITHRLYVKFFHETAIQQTVRWLEQHGVPYWDLCFMRDKAAVGANLYIEDSPANVTSLRRDGHETIVFTNSTNRDLDGPRADSWADVEALVIDAMERWKDGDQQTLPGV